MPVVTIPGTNYSAEYPDNWSQDQISNDLQKLSSQVKGMNNADVFHMAYNSRQPTAPATPVPPTTSAQPSPSTGGIGENLAQLAETIPVSAYSTALGMVGGLSQLGSDVTQALPGFGLMGGVASMAREARKPAEEFLAKQQTMGGKAGKFLGMALPAIAGGEVGLPGLVADVGFGGLAYDDAHQAIQDYQKRTNTQLPWWQSVAMPAAVSALSGALMHWLPGGKATENMATAIKDGAWGQVAKNFLRAGAVSDLHATAYGATNEIGQALYDPEVRKRLGMEGSAEEREKNLANTLQQYSKQFMENLPGAMLTVGTGAGLKYNDLRRMGLSERQAEEAIQAKQAQQEAAAPGTPVTPLTDEQRQAEQQAVAQGLVPPPTVRQVRDEQEAVARGLVPSRPGPPPPPAPPGAPAQMPLFGESGQLNLFGEPDREGRTLEGNQYAMPGQGVTAVPSTPATGDVPENQLSLGLDEVDENGKRVAPGPYGPGQYVYSGPGGPQSPMPTVPEEARTPGFSDFIAHGPAQTPRFDQYVYITGQLAKQGNVNPNGLGVSTLAYHLGNLHDAVSPEQPLNLENPAPVQHTPTALDNTQLEAQPVQILAQAAEEAQKGSAIGEDPDMQETIQKASLSTLPNVDPNNPTVEQASQNLKALQDAGILHVNAEPVAPHTPMLTPDVSDRVKAEEPEVPESVGRLQTALDHFEENPETTAEQLMAGFGLTPEEAEAVRDGTAEEFVDRFRPKPEAKPVETKPPETKPLVERFQKQPETVPDLDAEDFTPEEELAATPEEQMDAQAKKKLAAEKLKEAKKSGKPLPIDLSKVNIDPRLLKALKDPLSYLYKRMVDVGLHKHVQLRFSNGLETTAGQAATGHYGWDNGMPYILLAMDKIDPHDSPEAVIKKLMPHFEHEMSHAMDEFGIYTDRRWTTLLQKARTAEYQHRLETGSRTPWEEAVHYYTPEADALKLNDADRNRLFEKEAVAIYLQDMATGALPRTTTFNGVMQDVGNFLQASKKALHGMGYVTSKDIYPQWQTGPIIARVKRADDRMQERLRQNGMNAVERNSYQRYEDVASQEKRKQNLERIGYRDIDSHMITRIDPTGFAVSQNLPPDKADAVVENIFDRARKYANDLTMDRTGQGGMDKMDEGLVEYTQKRNNKLLAEGNTPETLPEDVRVTNPGAAKIHHLMQGDWRFRYFYELMQEIPRFFKIQDLIHNGDPAEVEKLAQFIAATSANRDPRQNLFDGLAAFSQWLQDRPITIGMPNAKPLQNVIHEGGQNSAKMQSFGENLFRHLMGNDWVPLTTNDMWVSRFFGVPENELNRYGGVMHLFSNKFHELLAEEQNKALKQQNGGKDLPAGMPWSWWQLQSMMWYNLRQDAERVARNDPEFKASVNDNYTTHMEEIAKILGKAGVPLDEQGRITRETLLHPSTPYILNPSAKRYEASPVASLEMRTPDKLHSDADLLRQRLEEKAAAGPLTDDEKKMRQALKTIDTRWLKNAKPYLGALAEQIYRDLGGTKKLNWGRMETGYGTWEGKASAYLNIPFHEIEDPVLREKTWDAFVSVVGHLFNQDAIGMTALKYDPANPTTHAVHVPKATPEQLEELSRLVGTDANTGLPRHNVQSAPLTDGVLIPFFRDMETGEFPHDGDIAAAAEQVFGSGNYRLRPVRELYSGVRFRNVPKAGEEGYDPSQQDYWGSEGLKLARQGRRQSEPGYRKRLERYVDDLGDVAKIPELRAGYQGELKSLTKQGRNLGHLPKLERGKARPFGEGRSGNWAVRRPNYEVRRVADEYKRENDIVKRPFPDEVPISVPLLKRVADTFHSFPHTPDDPKVAAAYRALADETIKQFRKMGGITAEPYRTGGEPYKNSEAMLDDVQHNKHLWYYPTDAAFGPEGPLGEPYEHPMLEQTAEKDSSGRPLLVNDIFRIVHDYFGHGQSGHAFGPTGEFNAYLDHSRMFSDQALPALAAETLGQNAWVNFGPHMRRMDGSIPEKGEPDWVPLADRTYADQKAMAMPESLLRDVDHYAEQRGNYSVDRDFHKDTSKPAREAIDGLINFRGDKDTPGWFTRWLKPSTFRDEAPPFWDKLYTKAVTGAHYLGQVERRTAGGNKLRARESAQKLAEDTGLSRPLFHRAISEDGGAPVFENNQVKIQPVKGPDGKPIGGMLGAVKDVLLKGLYKEYSYWHAMKRLENLALTHKNVKPIVDKHAERVAELDQKYGHIFRPVYNKIASINKAFLDFGLANGLLDPQAHAKFLKYGDYIPLKGAIEDQSEHGLGGSQQLANVSNILNKKFTGGEEWKVEDPLQLLIQNHYQILNSAFRNRAALEAIRTFQDGGVRMEKVASGYKPSGDEQTFNVWDGGKRVKYVTDDPKAFDVLTHINQARQLDPALGQIFDKFTRTLRFGATKNPAFAVANVVRDVMDARMLSGAEFNWVTEPLRALSATLGITENEYTPLLKTLKDAGIAGDHTIVLPHDPVKMAKRQMELEGAMSRQGWDGVKDKLLHFVDLYERKLDATDQVARLLVMKHVLESTKTADHPHGDEVQAIHAANMTMPFNRHGSSSVLALFRSMVPFLNSRIQGLDIVGRSLQGRNTAVKPGAPRAQLARKVLMRAGVMAMASSLYSYLSTGQPYYENSSDDVRDNYWLIPVGHGHALKIPIPFEFGLAFKTIPERIFRVMMGKELKQNAAAAVGRQALSTLSFNPIPQAVKPLTEAITNYDMYTGNPIVDQYQQKLQPSYQYRPSTSLLSRFAMSAANPVLQKMGFAGASPMYLDKLITGYTGTTGLYLMQMTDALLRHSGLAPQQPAMHAVDYPMMSHFFARPDGGQLMGQFYALQNTIEQATTTLKKIPPADRQAFYLRNKNLIASSQLVERLGAQLSRLRNQERLVQGSGLSPDEKRVSLDALRAAELQVLQPVSLLQKMARQ